jgi:hypothetical protein
MEGQVLRAIRDFFARIGPAEWASGWFAEVLLPYLLLGLAVGLLGGLITALSARWAEPTQRWSSTAGIFGGWFFCLLVGTVAWTAMLDLSFLGQAALLQTATRSPPAPLFGPLLPYDSWWAGLLSAAHGAGVGLAGGGTMAMALRRALPRARPFLVALGWAVAWGLGEGLLSFFYIDLYNAFLPVVGGLVDPDSAVLLVALAIFGAVIGLGGGVTTLWEIARARRRVEF